MIQPGSCHLLSFRKYTLYPVRNLFESISSLCKAQHIFSDDWGNKCFSNLKQTNQMFSHWLIFFSLRAGNLFTNNTSGRFGFLPTHNRKFLAFIVQQMTSLYFYIKFQLVWHYAIKPRAIFCSFFDGHI